MLTNTSSGIPASNGTIIRARVDLVLICCLDHIYSVCVTNVKIENLSCRHLPTTYESILIPCINSFLVKHKAANIFLLLYLSKCFLGIQNMLLWVIHHFIICKAQQILIWGALQFSLSHSFLFDKVPDNDHWVSWAWNKQSSIVSSRIVKC